ncbi:EAL domain-containing protein [Rhodobacterales bacterium]|nr:EAL domain-containing protein [Rhodobacterales bacterium]
MSQRFTEKRPDQSGSEECNTLSGFHASLLEVLPHAAVYVTRDGNILLHNKRMTAACELAGAPDLPRNLSELLSTQSWKRCKAVLSAAFKGVPAQASGLVTLRSGTNFCHHLICTSFVSLTGERQAVLLQFERQSSGIESMDAGDAAHTAHGRGRAHPGALLEHFPDDVLVFNGGEPVAERAAMLHATVGGEIGIATLAEALTAAGDQLPQTLYVPEEADYEKAGEVAGRRMCEIRLVPVPTAESGVETGREPDAASKAASAMAIIRRKVDCPAEIAENKRLAYLDPLTGLENRRAFTRSLTRVLDRMTADSGTGLAIIYIDLDEFKKVNDLAGHDTGDDMLLHVASCLRVTLGDLGTAARIGGDEFAGMIPAADERAALAIAEKIQDALDRIRLEHGERVFTISGSIGVAYVDGALAGNTFEAADLVVLADRACLRGKRHGGRSVHLQSVDPNDVGAQKGERTALSEPGSFHGTELALHAMPIMDLKKEAVCGSDVILRLKGERPSGMTSRAWKLAAGRAGFIAQVDTWALDRILDTAERSRNRSMLSMSVSVESAREASFRDTLYNRLTCNPLLAGRLCLEIQEKDYLREPSTVEAFFSFVSELGCQTVIDNFAGHWPVLSRLTGTRVEWLKLEAGLTQQVVEEPAKAAILSGLVRAAHQLGIKVMAKHVERAEEAEVLRDLGVEAALGYLFGKPHPWPLRQASST